MYNTYEKVSDVFIEPQLNFWHGNFIKIPYSVPHKCNNVITMHKKILHKYTHYVVSSHQIKIGEQEYKRNDGSTYTIPVYKSSSHKMPGGLHSYGLVWNHNVRHLLNKFCLGFIKPSYTLPTWLTFEIINNDVLSKLKYDDIVFEYHPQFTIILFGYAFSWWLTPPKASEHDFEDNYWESILYYLHNYDKDLYKTMDNCIYTYTKYSDFEKRCRDEVYDALKTIEYNSPQYKKLYLSLSKYPGVNTAFIGCRPEYIKDKALYNNIYEIIKENNTQYIFDS